jgi:putative phosphoribosyl transferase
VGPRTNRARFADRVIAGRALAALLGGYAGRDDVVVLGLPRGGVPVAAEVADALGATLDVLIVRKLGAPGQPELAMGAIAAIGDLVEVITNDIVVGRLGISAAEFDAVRHRELLELQRRTARYRGDGAPPMLRDRVVIIVDDGLATGSTMRAAVAAVRVHHPSRLVVAVPVGAADTCAALGREVDEVVCALTPRPFRAVHQGYLDFSQTSDAEVLALLRRVQPAGSGQHESGPQRHRAEQQATGHGQQAEHGEPAE